MLVTKPPLQCHLCQEIRPCFWGGIINLYNNIGSIKTLFPGKETIWGANWTFSWLAAHVLYLKVDIQSSKFTPPPESKISHTSSPRNLPKSPVESWKFREPGKTWEFCFVSPGCLTLADLLCIIWVVWWFQPIWKNISQTGNLHQIRDENKKDLKPPTSFVYHLGVSPSGCKRD